MPSYVARARSQCDCSCPIASDYIRATIPRGDKISPRAIPTHLADTGPMYMVYNATLRAWANTPPGTVASNSFPDSQWHTLRVDGRFIATIHSIASGTMELSKLSYGATVYCVWASFVLRKGIGGRILPKYGVHDSYFSRGEGLA